MTRAGSSAVARAWSSGRKNLVVWKTPCTLRSSTRFHDAASCSASGTPQVAPALLTSTSTWSWSGADRLGEALGARLGGQVGGDAGARRRRPTARRRWPRTASALREDTITVAPPGDEAAGDHPADATGAAGDHDHLAGDGEEVGGEVGAAASAMAGDRIPGGAGSSGAGRWGSGWCPRASMTDRAQDRCRSGCRAARPGRSSRAGAGWRPRRPRRCGSRAGSCRRWSMPSVSTSTIAVRRRSACGPADAAAAGWTRARHSASSA